MNKRLLLRIAEVYFGPPDAIPTTKHPPLWIFMGVKYVSMLLGFCLAPYWLRIAQLLAGPGWTASMLAAFAAFASFIILALVGHELVYAAIGQASEIERQPAI